ncbi:MAG: phosphoenolpyruvate--protein phosphotransferase [Candidatus Marinimicrobia bacterium]|nr:phosphoenolpyruvate--protein phosphotransferase [Candidatus Neomarinimicrobiota bacterium]
MIIREDLEILQGQSASSGIVIGHAYVRKVDNETIIPRTLISEQNIPEEMSRLTKAQDMVAEELELVRKKIEENLGPSYSDIISAQIAILRDHEIIKEVRAYIEEHHVNVAFAYRVVVNQYVELLEDHASEYFRERVADIRDIRQRVLRALISKQTVLSSLELDTPTIFIAKELNPADIMMLVTENVLGFITEFGGKTSHASILARAMKVPMIIGVKDATFTLESGQRIILDANQGNVLIQPSQETLDQYAREMDNLQAQELKYQAESHKKAVTQDGFQLKLSANISLPFEVDDIIKYGGDGVGLYRTEYLYLMKQHLPDEEELFREYVRVVKSLPDQEVIIRTIDLGGDKMSALWDLNIRNEANPFMGYRAIRICLDHPQVFITQIRAILRSSAFGKVCLLIPMITHLEQLTESLEIIERVKRDLEHEKIAFDRNIKTGIMVETPSVVMNIEAFAEKADYFSIGTNDLTQYSLAVDRGNERVTKIYNHYDPAIIKMLQKIIDAGHRSGIPVYICGEMGSEEQALYLLLAMKADGVSVAPRYLGTVRNFINRQNQKKAAKHLNEILCMKNRKDIIDAIDKLIG